MLIKKRVYARCVVYCVWFCHTTVVYTNGLFLRIAAPSILGFHWPGSMLDRSDSIQKSVPLIGLSSLLCPYRFLKRFCCLCFSGSSLSGPLSNKLDRSQHRSSLASGTCSISPVLSGYIGMHCSCRSFIDLRRINYHIILTTSISKFLIFIIFAGKQRDK